MNDGQYSQLKSLFIEARALAGAERDEGIRRRCGDDDELREGLERLLSADDEFSDDVSMPDRIGPYEVAGVLGVGGMGVVYRARQESPRRDVALKVLHPGFLSRSTAHRFALEVEVLGRLQHPGIAQVFEAGATGDGGQPFFVMELVEGLPLIEYADRHELDVGERLQLILKICRAVEHAHVNGVIHRDLKPANILVAAAGEPKILDFGVARLTDSDIRTTTLRT
jgi:serine/threonine protein kinase